LRLDPFADLRDVKASASGPAAGHRAASETELAQYKALTVPAAAAVELLAFWRQNTEQFPILSMTACSIFCISASSAQSERDFYSVGHTVTEMRSRLSSKKIEAMERAHPHLRRFEAARRKRN